MGLYSRNTISSIAVNESDEIENKNQETPEVKDEVQESTVEESAKSDEEEVEVPTSIDPDVEAMLADDEYAYDEGYFDNIDIDDGFNGLIESCINVNELDKKLFESLIELDFKTVCTEHTLGTSESVNGAGANDAKKDNIIMNIDKVFVGMESSIKQLGARTASNLATLIENDSKIYEKYAKVLENADSVEGFEGINMYFPTKESVENMDKVLEFKSINSVISEGAKNIAKATSRDEVNSIVNSIRESLDSISDEFVKDINESLKETNWIPSDDDINVMKEFANNNIAKKALILSVQEAVSDIQDLRKNVGIACDMCTESDELNTYKLNKIYNVSSTAVKSFAKKFQIHNDLFVREAAALRKGIMIAGNYAIKHTMLDEATLENVISKSDTYVFDLFDK